MRRADRLLQIIQILRRQSGPIAASRIAEELEVSLRTLYRDMVSLEATGVPIRGEAGVGYVLEDGYDMPPLMFTVSELEALMLGARMLDGRVDDALSRAAQDAVAKIANSVPDNLRGALIDAPLFAPIWTQQRQIEVDMAEVRRALRTESQVEIDYLDLKDQRSQRVIWPVLLSIFEQSTVIAAWCTLRNGFRAFRADRITRFDVLEKRSPKPRKTLFAEWKKAGAGRYRRPDFTKDKIEKLRGV